MGQLISHSRVINLPFKPRTDLHLARKLWHISTGVVGLLFYSRSGLSDEKVASMLMIVAVLAFAIDFIRVRHQGLNNLVLTYMRPIMRESEKQSYSGLPFYALGVSLSLFFYSSQIAVLSVLFLIFADPIASFFGILYGRDKITKNKSLQGTLAAFTVCYLITLIYALAMTGSSINVLLFAIIAAAIGALSELCSQFVDDNLCIPVLSGFGLMVINYFLPVFR